jgi:hypothetical protein
LELLQFGTPIAPVEDVTLIEVEFHVVAPEQVALNFSALESWGKRSTVSVIGRGTVLADVEKLVMWGTAIREASRLTTINKPRMVGNTNLPTNARIRHTSTLLCKVFFSNRPLLRVERIYVVADWLRI